MNLLLGFALCSFFVQCDGSNHDSKNQISNVMEEENNKLTESNDIVIFGLDSTNNWMSLFEGAEPASLDKKEITQIENLFIYCFNKSNIKDSSNQLHLIDRGLIEYKRQYIPYINKDGEKEVWINCFCSSFKDDKNWREKLVLVKDGGDCYFNLKINLDKNLCKDIVINGN
jgi:hypothetical protein